MQHDLERIALGRLMFIRKLIDLAYSYGHDKELFYRKFVETIDLPTLKKHEIVEIGEHALDRDEKAVLRNPRFSTKEVELRCLEKQGFNQREMSIILGMKNPGSIRVKLHRLHKKLNREIDGVANPGSLAFGVAFLLLISIFLHFIK